MGGAADDVLASLTPGRARVVRNDAYGEGCASSLLAGLAAAGPCAAVMLLLGDMPGVDVSVIDTVGEDWERHRPWGAVTSYRGDLGHPFVFAAEAFPVLRGLHGDKAVWKLIDRQPPPGDMRRVPIDRPLPPDIDTWDDYREALAALVSSADPPG